MFFFVWVFVFYSWLLRTVDFNQTHTHTLFMTLTIRCAHSPIAPCLPIFQVLQNDSKADADSQLITPVWYHITESLS